MKRTRRLILTLATVILACCAMTITSRAQQSAPPAQTIRFAADIEAFLKQDQVNPPPKGGILFIGSSIFRQWKNLKEQMAPLPVFNRAFGGSRTPEILYYMDKIVLPYEPKIIVYYCGSNDVNAGETAERISENFRQFAERVWAKLPATRIYYVSINRAPQKIDRWNVVDAANNLIRTYCEKDKKLGFIDVNPALFDREGNPRLELYQPDKLHFKDPAYDEFTAIIKPVISKSWAADRR
ncbi:MAG: hypothetical protein IPO77_21535 [Acidobacteria bacterium]|nr:hypothetical protein [Acidobacteriota bacterium]